MFDSNFLDLVWGNENLEMCSYGMDVPTYLHWKQNCVCTPKYCLQASPLNLGWKLHTQVFI